MSGPKDSRGYQVYPGFPYDTGIASTTGIRGLVAIGPGPFGPPTTEMTIDIDKPEENAPQPLIDALSTNLTTFSGNGGGKLIFYHGVSDPWFSALDTLGYYKAMVNTNGGITEVSQWSQLFLVPGMGHCGGGVAALDDFDMLTAIVNWVERGNASESVIATGKAFPGRSRPLYPYPKHAQYSGKGDSEDAKNFACQ
jgi:feruloyl esterase